MKKPHRTWAAFGLSLLLGIFAATPAKSDVAPFVESDATWKVLDNGTDPGANWKTIGFSDAAWRSVPGSFGYKVEAPATYTSNAATSILNFNAGNVVANPKYITTYFRKTFAVTNPASFVALFVSLRFDDGAVVYLNGTEIRRENMPAGTPAVGTLAPTAINTDASTSTVFSLASPFNTLLQTNNILAVELHQASNTSSDVFLEVGLDGFTSVPAFGNATPGVYQIFADGTEQFNNSGNYFDPPRYPAGYDYMNHYGFRRDPNNSGDVLLQYEFYSKRISSPTSPVLNPPVGVIYGADRRVLLGSDVHTILNTERIDTRNYKNVKASIAVASLDNSGGWETTDYLKGTIIYSLDGNTFTEIPWFNYQASGTGSLAHVLVDTNAPFHWMVPTISAANANTTTNPQNWRQRVPIAPGPVWTAYNVPPGLTTSTPNTWHNGNAAASTIKGGIGYDNSASPIDFAPLIDSGSIAQARTELYTKESRVNVRYPFTVPAPLTGVTITKVELQVRFDDAFIAYLNGTQIAFEGVTLPEVDTVDPAARDDATATTYKTYDVTPIVGTNPATTLLRHLSGNNDNVLAVRGFNAGKASSDMLLGARLIYYTPIPQPFSPAALESPTGDTMTTLDTGTLIPPTARSVRIRVTSHIEGNEAEYFMIDDLRYVGDSISATNLGTTLDQQLPSATVPFEKRTYTADADGDGIPNMLEYAFGSNAGVAGRTVPSPSNPTASITPQYKLLSDGFSELKFRTLSSDSSVNFATAAQNGYVEIKDMRYLFQYSDDAFYWSEYGHFFFDDLPASRVSNDDGTQTVTLRSSLSVLAAHTRFFYRIKAEPIRPSWLNQTLDSSIFPDPL